MKDVLQEETHTIPIPATVHDLYLLLHLGNIVLGPGRGIDAVLEGSILRGKPESIPTHGENWLAGVECLESGEDVGDSIDSQVAHVKRARRIREHG